MRSQPKLLTTCIIVALVLHVQAISLQSKPSLRGNSSLPLEESDNALDFTLVQNLTVQLQNSTNEKKEGTLLRSGSYVSCHIHPSHCAVNVAKVTQELGPQIVLLFGCSLDIYAVDYFCKAAGSKLVGFERSPGVTKYAPGNFAHCNIGGLILAFSFHPGVSGPPYFEMCEKVLGTSCMQVTASALLQQSLARIQIEFGRPPTTIVVDSSLWDVAAWYLQDGKPPEPYTAPAAHINNWCYNSFPALLQFVHMNSPLSKIAFRTAPRIEFMKGYGHSMGNIDAMNYCLRQSSLTTLSQFRMIDFNQLVETMVVQQGVAAKAYYDDAFHPGLIPSVIYVDWVLQWTKAVQR